MGVTLAFDPVRHTYTADGVLVPSSVTGILKAAGYVNLPNVWPGILAAGRERGQRVHAAIALALENDLDWASVEEDEQGYVRAALDAVRVLGLRAITIERMIYHPTYQYAGRVDLTGTDGRASVVLDWKTGDPEDTATDLQLAGYHLALATTGFAASARRVGVQLDRDGRFHPTEYDNPADYTAFLAAVAHVGHLRQRGRI